MNTAQDKCTTPNMLKIAAIVGVVILVLLLIFSEFGFFSALFISLLIGIAAFVGLVFWCASQSQAEIGAGPAAGAVGGGSGAAIADKAAKPAAAAGATVAATAAGSSKSADATKPGSGAAAGATGADPKPGAAGASSVEATPTAKPNAAKAKPAAKAKATPKAASAAKKDKPTQAPAGATATGPGDKPATLAAPRSGGADNLKAIKGVGPKMEKMLNDMGFYHFDQVAAWTASEVAWVDQNLKGFKGRVSRDNWVAQAKTLAAGGETEFSAKVGKGGVY